MAKSLMKDLSGQRFGRLVAIKPTKERIKRNVVWLCRCDCGAIKKINGNNLKNGNTHSCGCLKKEMVTKRGRATKTHGHTTNGKHSATYGSWRGMIQRCTNPKNKDYKYYGGRGIKFCNSWLKFKGFLKDMGEKPRTTSIERKDNDGDYEPDNCKWANAIAQARNNSHTRLNPLKAQIIKKLLKESNLMIIEIAEIFNVSRGAIKQINRGKTWVNVN